MAPLLLVEPTSYSLGGRVRLSRSANDLLDGGDEVTDRHDRLEALLEFPLMNAVFGRRARRFGMGMEILSGPLAFRSEREAMPLTELERSILVGAATGVSGWSFGVPFGPRTPDSHAEFTLRFTGRTFYDAHYGEGAYLSSHADHLELWHGSAGHEGTRVSSGADR
jgi:hypothetical protein